MLKATQSIGVHEFIINKFCNKTKEVINNDYVFFNRNIKDLKKFRIDSDYKNIEINYSNGQKALEIANAVNSKIIENFHV